MGSFSVMLISVEQRLHVTREMSSVAGSLVIFGSALIAPGVGVIMARYSLRLLMTLGALMSLAGYLILAFTSSYPLYIGCYLLLFGPSMAIAGSVGPATLVTRWFGRRRGLALGLVHFNIVVAVVPLLSNWMLEHHGASSTYLLMAALVGFGLLPFTLLIRNYPPGADPHASAAGTPAAQASADAPGVAEIIRQPRFWGLAITAAATITGTMVLTFNMIPLTTSLGVDRDHGALLQSIMSVSGMFGSIFFGWVADRLGGARGLALIVFDMAVLFGLLLLDLPFAGLTLVIALLGMHGAGTIPNISRALGDAFGAASFSRAFGLSTSLSVPFTVIALQGVAATYTRTQTYSPAIAGLAVFYLLILPIALAASGRRKARVSLA
ncbi:MAG: MFS transporter [Sphingomonadales bacterium]|nr:MFS transporter [Sphingomonadales bacterium]